MATKKSAVNLSLLSDKELQAELNRRNEERQAPKREATKRLGQITNEIDRLLLEAGSLCKEHKIFFQYQIEDMQISINDSGFRTTESTWEESTSWASSDYNC